MAASLKKDDVVILRIDGEDLKEFIESSQFESQMIDIFPRLDSANNSLRTCVALALQQLTVEHGMPPSSDAWVVSNIVEPALQSISVDQLAPISQEMFLEEFRKLVDDIVRRLQEHPVIVAHSETSFDGSSIKSLLSDNAQLNKILDVIWRNIQNDQNQDMSGHLRTALDGVVANLVDLPPCGAIDQIDAIANEVLRALNADEKEILHEEEFKKTMTEILEEIMLRLEENPVLVPSNSVVEEPLASTADPSSPLPLPETE